MEQQRNILFIILLMVGMVLYWNWESDKVKAQMAIEEAQAHPELAAETGISSDSSGYGKTVKLISDSLDLQISLKGGDIIDAKLPKIKQEQDKEDPFHLLMSTRAFTYQAQSGLAGPDGLDSRERPEYTAQAETFTLADGADEVSAVLSLEKDGVIYKKIYTLHRDSYVVDVKYEVDNQSAKTLQMCFYGQLKQTEDASVLEENSSFAMVASAYRGTAYSTENTRYEKLTLSDIISDAKSDPLKVTTKGGWVSMIQHYFVSAWVGDAETQNFIYSNASRDEKDAIIGIRSDVAQIAPQSSHTFSSKMWIGPKNQDDMSEVANNLDLTVDYGWLWFISIPLFKLLQFIHSFVGNWGFSIIVLTLVVRGCMFPLTKAQYTSMAKMRMLTPKLTEMRERYKDDRQKLGQETMKMYKQEKVNPMGGCLPLLIQMPIFIALYWTLMESTELRQSSFILWIKDLSVYDPFFVLPILYGVSMFMLQKMSPTPLTDPMQRKIFMAMPFVFTFMFCTFPAGLTLYWLVSNCFTIFQQTVIYRSLEKKGLSVRNVKTPAKKE